MLILLPASEGKARPESGEPVDLDALAYADELGGKRVELIEAFDPSLREAPAAPAHEVYTGALFKRLKLPEMPAAARAERLLAAGSTVELADGNLDVIA